MRNQLLYGLLLLLGTACNHKYYAPNKVNTPFIEKTGEGQLSVGAYTADEFTGFNVQASYRPMVNLVTGVNAFSASSNQNATTNEGGPNAGRGYFGELFIGPYWQVNQNMAVSMLVGGGFGNTKHDYGFDKSATLNFQRQFIQPNLKYRKNRFSVGTGLRLCRLDYTGGDVNAAIERDELNTILAIDERSPFYLPELGLNIGFIGKAVTVEYSVTNLLYNNNYTYRFADRTIGLDFIFNPSTILNWVQRKKKAK